MDLLPREHLFLNVASDIDSLLTPLKEIGIAHFSYVRNFMDGSQIYLSNGSKWIEDYYNLALYQGIAFESNPANISCKFMVWDQNSGLDIIRHASQYFGSYNGITLFYPQQDSCEFFFYCCTFSKMLPIEFYLSNLDVLEKFATYFKVKLRILLQKAEAQRIIIPQPTVNSTPTYPFLDGELHSKVEAIRSFLSSSLANIIEVNGKVISLSNREGLCLGYLLQGKSAKQTARALNLSVRTIEEYLNQIKKKAGCRTKIDLISKLMAKDKQ